MHQDARSAEHKKGTNVSKMSSTNK